MKKPQPTSAFLGVVATGRAVYAALVERGPDGPSVVHTYFRQRHTAAGAAGGGLPGGVPGSGSGGFPAMGGAGMGGAGMGAGGMGGGAIGDDAGDFTIQFGNGGGGGGGANLFLNSEFGGADPKGDGDGDGDERQGAAAFAVELSEILDECAAAGYTNPTLVFAAPTGHVTATELTIPESRKGRKDREKAEKAEKVGKSDRAPRPGAAGEAPTPGALPSHDALYKLLKEQHADADSDRSAFLGMTSRGGVGRALALTARAADAVPPTLDQLRKQPAPPVVGFLDTELSLYLGLARFAAEADGGVSGDMLVVRAGTEDTVVLFIRGGHLHHAETLRSLTAFDAPETICSRILLQQDECGVDEVAEVFVLSEQGEGPLVASFDTFFDGARVRPLRRALAALADGRCAELPDALLVPAAAAALRAAGDADVFPDVNLLSRRYLRRRVQLPVSWHVLAMTVVLFSTALFFTWRYFDTQTDIHAAREQLRIFPPTLAEEDAQTLQARIDSLESTYAAYSRALGVLDSLLVGSDRWSRTLEKTAQETNAVRGIWIDTWTPGRDLLTLDGTATTRDRVVAFAERTGGDIESLTFSEIREWPVYAFRLRMPLPNDLPEAAEYLREQALALAAADAARAGAAPDSAAPDSAAAPSGAARQAADAPRPAERPPVRAVSLDND